MVSLLDAAEAASPVEAVEAVTRELGLALGAIRVSFLIADLSGRALVRLAHVRLDGDGDQPTAPLALGERRTREESATLMPFDGRLEEQVVRAQQLRVAAPDPSAAEPELHDKWRVLAPVTARGEVIGLLEVVLPDDPGESTVGDL